MSRSELRAHAAAAKTEYPLQAMALPTYDQFIEPLLRFLAERPEGARTSEVYATLADRTKLSELDRQALLPSREQPVYQNRIGWAHDRLKRAGLSSSPKRGVWMLTSAGTAYVKVHPAALSDDDVATLATVARGSRLTPATAVEDLPEALPSADRQSPTERIETALAELRDSVEDELLTLIAESSPEFFENLVLDLLHKMGYGTSRADLQRVGRTGDGGIDGIIALDKLGLEKVYVQAKRWKGNVGRPEVQGFSGALVGRRAKRGVFITTSGYTADALEYAEQVSDTMVLVDGDRLASLMVAHGVGVQHTPIQVPQVDNDYFEDG